MRQNACRIAANAIAHIPFAFKLLTRMPSLRKRIETEISQRPIRKNIRTADGFLMNIDTSDFIQRTIFLSGDWDHTISAVLRNRLQPGQSFIDVGANVGFFSLLAAKLIGQSGRVISFEPNPIAFQKLKENAAMNGFTWIEAHQKGLFNQEGSGTLFIPDTNCGGATLRPGGKNGLAVPLIRLDDIVEGKIDLMKIDIEGAEVAALRGAHRLLSGENAPDVICEVSEYSLREMGSSKDELYDLMARYGYSPTVISPIGRSNLSTQKVFFQYDVFFSKH